MKTQTNTRDLERLLEAGEQLGAAAAQNWDDSYKQAAFDEWDAAARAVRLAMVHAAAVSERNGN